MPIRNGESQEQYLARVALWSASQQAWEKMSPADREVERARCKTERATRQAATAATRPIPVPLTPEEESARRQRRKAKRSAAQKRRRQKLTAAKAVMFTFEEQKRAFDAEKAVFEQERAAFQETKHRFEQDQRDEAARRNGQARQAQQPRLDGIKKYDNTNVVPRPVRTVALPEERK
jgi:hypothetical protein